MSLNTEGRGRCIAKLGDNLVFLDTNDRSGSREMQCSKYDVTNQFEQVPDISKRETCLYAGPSGSGKSICCRKGIINFHELFPSAPVYIISRLMEDPAYDDLDFVQRIPMDLFKDPEIEIKPEEFKDCLVVFDDVDQFEKGPLEKVQLLRKQLLELGRKQNCYIFCTVHMLMNYRATRDLINESQSVTVFPGSGWYYINRFLREYCGFSREVINGIKNTKSRWVTIYTNYPKVILEEKRCYIPK